MALARILVDGYSLLHGWPAVASGGPRYSAAARDELIRVLTHYRDAIGTPVTIVFDGAETAARAKRAPSTPELEVLFSTRGQTADQIIERVVYRLVPLGDVLVVTDDYAERETVINLGGMAASCANFIDEVDAAQTELHRNLERFNSRERRQFKRAS